jgi:hypothetical protein
VFLYPFWLFSKRLGGDRSAKRGLAETEDEIDRAAAKLWALTDAELNEIHKALELLR